MESTLIDTRFCYESDNPWNDDPTGDKKRKLKKYISMRPDDFTEIDYLIDNRYMILYPDTEELFGQEVEDSDLRGTLFNNRLKLIILSAPCASEELKVWAKKIDVVSTSGGSGSSASSSTAVVVQDGQYVPYSTNTQIDLSKVLEGGTMYDMYSERTITYDELRKISINIARSLRNPTRRADSTLLELENEERRKLINTIQEFKNVTVISPYIEEDIGRMTVDQLKTLRDKCEKLHSQFKVNEVLKSGFNVCSIAYDTLFPDGIPISKTKRIQFGGIGDDIKNKLLDNTKTIGFGFTRFLQKHDINITDELTILIAMGEILASKAKIVSTKEKKEEDSDETTESESESGIDTDTESESEYDEVD